MALRAGYYGIKRALNEKLKNLPGFSAIGIGLQITDKGELEVTGATMTIDPNPEGAATESLEKLQIGETIYGVNDNTKCYQTDDTTESAIVDADYVPFYDTSASAPKKSTWSNFCNKIQSKLNAFVTWVANSKIGVHNRLVNKGTLSNVNGVTFTVNDDYTISLSGEASATAIYEFEKFYVKNGESYIISSGFEGSTDNFLGIMIGHDSGSYDYSVTTQPVTITASADTYILCKIRIASGTDTTGFKFFPMVRDAADTDTTFAPPAMTNSELTERFVKVPFTVPATLDALTKLADYPSGYNKSNSVLVTFSIDNRIGEGMFSTSYMRCFAALDDNEIKIYNAESNSVGKSGYVILGKL